MGEERAPLLATSQDHVGISAWDYYSWGHIGMGIASFLIFSLINTIPSLVDKKLVYLIPYWSILLLVVAFAVGWEILENTLLLSWGFKFEGRKDSLQNSFWDILFVTLGGLIMWVVKGILVDWWGGIHMIPLFYILGFIAFIVVLILFFIGYFITGKMTRESRQKQKIAEASKSEKHCPDCGNTLKFISSGVYRCDHCNKTVLI